MVYDVYDCIDGANIPKAFDPYEHWKTHQKKILAKVKRCGEKNLRSVSFLIQL